MQSKESKETTIFFAPLYIFSEKFPVCLRLTKKTRKIININVLIATILVTTQLYNWDVCFHSPRLYWSCVGNCIGNGSFLVWPPEAAAAAAAAARAPDLYYLPNPRYGKFWQPHKKVLPWRRMLSDLMRAHLPFFTVSIFIEDVNMIKMLNFVWNCLCIVYHNSLLLSLVVQKMWLK